MFEFFKNRKVLVTGATGLVGVNLTARLLEIGAHVRAVYHHRPVVLKDSRIEYLQADLCRPEDCTKAINGMEFLFHCASKTSSAASIANNPLAHVTPNLVMHANLFQAAYEQKIQKVLWLSSTLGYPPSDQQMVEEDFLKGEPFEKYYFVGWMKRFVEILCKMYGEKIAHKMTMIVLRPSNIYGPHDNFDPVNSRVLPALMRKVIERQNPIVVWGDGENVRDLIYIDDLIDSILLAVQKLETTSFLNIGFGRGYSVKEMLNMILKIDGYSNAKIVFDSTKPNMVQAALVSTEKAEKLIGFRAKIGLEEGIKRTLAWYRQTYEKTPVLEKGEMKS